MTTEHIDGMSEKVSGEVDKQVSVCLGLVKRYSVTYEKRHIIRVIRYISFIKNELDEDIVVGLLKNNLDNNSFVFGYLMSFVPRQNQMDVDFEVPNSCKMSSENELFFVLLMSYYLTSIKEYRRGLEFMQTCIRMIKMLRSRLIDPILSKLYYLRSICAEKLGILASIRNEQIAAYRSSVIDGNAMCKAVLINLVLWNYIYQNNYNMAEKFTSKVEFPEDSDNSQLARFYYFRGAICAVKLDYASSYKFLIQALRKVPQTNNTLRFRLAVTKLSVLVQLLIGDLPDKSIFHIPKMKHRLKAYSSLVKAVGSGSLSMFQNVLATCKNTFIRDKTYNLVIRLRQNVIKTGIRLLGQTYSQISLDDVCRRLQLGNPLNAEYVMSKAIKDGVLDAVIDSHTLKTKELANDYATCDPQESLGNRAKYCFSLYVDIVRAMRFPDSVRNADKTHKQSDFSLEEHDGFLDMADF